MKRKLTAIVATLILCMTMLIPDTLVQAAQTLYNNATGTEGGYNYELWKDYGTTSMTLNGGGNFSCSWSNIGNALFRKGIKWDCTKNYQQIGNITVNYGCNYQPNGNSYLCLYGWSRNPLVEYYIVESWGTWRPPGASSRGTITVDGGTYDVYCTDRINQPSIDGNTTFKQYWSVRTSKKTSGTISVTEHFKAWERMGLKLGNLYEAALTVEGYQSSGQANVYKNEIIVGGNGGGGNYNPPQTSQQPQQPTSGNFVECENMQKSGQYTGNIGNPFNGVALYANNDSIKTTAYFSQGNHNFTLRGCSNNNNMARADLKIDGQYKGTFYYGGPYPAEYTIQNVWVGSGNHTVEIVVTADDGQWDQFCDWLKWS